MKRGPVSPARSQCASRCGALVAGRSASSSASRGTGATARNAAATPSTPQVSGSSKNPAYSSEWTKSARSTAARATRARRPSQHEVRPSPGAEHPEIDGEADDAALREHRQRRRVRRVPAGRPPARELGARARLPADADAAIGRSAKASRVTVTRRERPLVASRADAPRSPARRTPPRRPRRLRHRRGGGREAVGPPRTAPPRTRPRRAPRSSTASTSRRDPRRGTR